MADWWCPEPWLRFAPIFGEKIEAAIDGARIGYYDDSYWAVPRHDVLGGLRNRYDSPPIISLSSRVGPIRLMNVIYFLKEEQFMTFGELSFNPAMRHGVKWYPLAEIAPCVVTPIEIFPDRVNMDDVTRFLLNEKTGGFANV